MDLTNLLLSKLTYGGLTSDLEEYCLRPSADHRYWVVDEDYEDLIKRGDWVVNLNGQLVLIPLSQDMFSRYADKNSH